MAGPHGDAGRWRATTHGDDDDDVAPDNNTCRGCMPKRQVRGRRAFGRDRRARGTTTRVCCSQSSFDLSTAELSYCNSTNRCTQYTISNLVRNSEQQHKTIESACVDRLILVGYWREREREKGARSVKVKGWTGGTV